MLYAPNKKDAARAASLCYPVCRRYLAADNHQARRRRSLVRLPVVIRESNGVLVVHIDIIAWLPPGRQAMIGQKNGPPMTPIYADKKLILLICVNPRHQRHLRAIS